MTVVEKAYRLRIHNATATEGYFDLPGATGDYVTGPDVEVASDLEVEIDLSIDDLTPSSIQYIASKLEGVGNRSWDIQLITTGAINIRTSADGSAILDSGYSTVLGTVVSAGERFTLKVTMDVDDGAGNRVGKVYVNGTQLGPDLTTAGVASIYASGNETIKIGRVASSPIAGTVYSFRLMDGIGGAVIASVGEGAFTSSTYVDPYGNTWTLQGNTTHTGGWDHTFTKFAKPPVVGGQRVYPLQGKTTSKPWVCEIVDDSEDVTAALAEEIGSHWRYTLLRRKADVSVADDGGSFSVLATGRIADIQLSENQAVYRFTLQDERHTERNTQVFSFSNTTTIWPPGTNLSTGYYAHRNPIRLSVTEWNYAAPVSAVRFKNFNGTIWPGSVQSAINDDLKPDGRTTRTPNGVTDGSFVNLRLNVAGADYEVLAFAYTTDDLDIGGSTDIAIGSKPAKNDDPVGVFVIDPAHDLDGTDRASAYFYFPSRTDDEGYKVGFAPTEDVPLHIEGNVWDILQSIYDGDYGGEVVSYNTTQLSSLQSDARFPPGVAYRVTKPENMAKWVEENIYKPFMCVPLISADGTVFPQPLLLPDASTISDVSALDVIDVGTVTEPVTWEHRSADQITRATFKFPGRQTASGLITGDGLSSEYSGSLDRYSARELTKSFDRRTDEFGVQEFEIPAPAIYPDSGEPENASGSHSFAEVWSDEWLDRYGDGSVVYQAKCFPSVTAVVGDYVVINCTELHTPNAGLRSGSRIAQVISRSVGVAYNTLELLDAGPYLNAVSAPTVAITQNASDPKHTLRIEITGLGINDYELQLARGIAAPATLDFFMIASGDESIVDVGGLPSGTGWTCRARAIGPQRIRSAWSVIDNASTSSYSAPSAVTATATGTEIAVTWTNSDDTLETEVWYDTLTPFDEDTATLFETFQAGTASTTVGDLPTSTLIYIYCRHIGPYGTRTATASDSDTTGGSATTLANPTQIYIENGASIGTRTAP